MNFQFSQYFCADFECKLDIWEHNNRMSLCTNPGRLLVCGSAHCTALVKLTLCWQGAKKLKKTVCEKYEKSPTFHQCRYIDWVTTFLYTVPPVSASLNVPDSAESSSGSRSGISLTAGSWYNVSCSASGSSPFVFYNWSLSRGPAERDKQVTLSILIRGWIMDEIFGQITWFIYARALMTNEGCDDQCTNAVHFI